MKNSYSKLPLIVLILILIGCQPEELKTSNVEANEIANEQESTAANSKISVKNDMLSFASREDYDSTIENLAQMGDENFEDWEKGLGFTSMRSVYDIDGLMKRGISDPLLAAIINPSGMIEIDGNIFTLDLLAEKVTMISSSDYINKSLSAKSKREFSTNDDILDILDGTVTQEASETARKYCRSQRKTGSISVDGSRTTYVMEYRRAGILNTLGAIIFRKYNVTGFAKTTGTTFYANKKRCIMENNRRSNFSGNYSIVRIYNSSRRLKSFTLDIEFSAHRGSLDNLRISRKRDKIYCGTQVPCTSR